VQSPNTIGIVSRNCDNQSGEEGVGARLYGVVLGLTNTVVLGDGVVLVVLVVVAIGVVVLVVVAIGVVVLVGVAIGEAK